MSTFEDINKLLGRRVKSVLIVDFFLLSLHTMLYQKCQKSQHKDLW